VEVGNRKEIYRRIENAGGEGNVWVGIEGRAMVEKEDENCPKEYKNKGIEVVAGYDYNKEIKEIKGLGIYGKYKMDKIEQGGNSGEVMGVGLGVYGGAVRGKVDIKTIIEGSVDKYKTTREPMVGISKEKSEGEFGGIKGSIEVEGGYNIKVREGSKPKSKLEQQLMKEIEIRPYGGIRGVIVKTDGFKETGTYPLRLEVKENNYVRATIRTGIGIKGEGDILRWAAGAGVECCAIGRHNEINNVIIDTKEEFKSKSMGEGTIKGEGEVSLEYDITQKVGAYVDGRLGLGSGYSNINVGIKCVFGL
jgi:hypothetical protein